MSRILRQIRLKEFTGSLLAAVSVAGASSVATYCFTARSPYAWPVAGGALAVAAAGVQFIRWMLKWSSVRGYLGARNDQSISEMTRGDIYVLPLGTRRSVESKSRYRLVIRHVRDLGLGITITREAHDPADELPKNVVYGQYEVGPTPGVDLELATSIPVILDTPEGFDRLECYGDVAENLADICTALEDQLEILECEDASDAPEDNPAGGSA